MKVIVTCTRVVDEIIEIDDNFADLVDEDMPPREWETKRNKMLTEVFRKIPSDWDVMAVYDEETDNCLYEA